jgi:hypothetical protein
VGKNHAMGQSSTKSDQDATDIVAGGRKTLAILLLCVGILISLLTPLPISGRLTDEVTNLAHAPLFATITLGALLLLRRRFSGSVPTSVVLSVACIAFLFGVMIELAQSFSGRSPAMEDAISNGYGVIAGLIAFWALAATGVNRWLSIMLLLIALVVLGYAIRTPGMRIFDFFLARWSFPALASFESSREFDRFYFHGCEPSLTRKDATDGEFAIELSLSNEQRNPGMLLLDFGRDWSAVESLELDVVLDASYPEENLAFRISVIDGEPPRGKQNQFSRDIQLTPGQPQHVSISRQELLEGPETRQLNLSQIEVITLHALSPVEPTKIRIDAIKVKL